MTIDVSKLIVDLTTRTLAGFYNSTFFARPSGLATFQAVSGDTVNVPVESSIVEATSVSAGVTISTADTYTPTTTAIALGKVGMLASATYEELADVNNGDNLSARLSARIIQGVSQKADKDVFAVLAATTNNDGAVSATTLKVKDLFKSVANIRSANYSGRIVAFVSPAQYYDLQEQLSGFGSTTIPQLSNLGNDVLSGSFVGNVGGAEVYVSHLITATNAAVYAVEGLHVGTKGGILVEAKQDESNQTWNFYATLRMKSAIVKANFIREIVTANSF